MRLGVFGGSFDPVHCGHLAMACAALRELELDGILWMPAGRPPHKIGKQQASNEDRLAMLALAIDPEPAFSLSRLEFDRAGLSYTALTLTQLKEEDPERELYFLVGADSLDYLDKWYHPEIIFEKAVIAVAARRPFSEEQMEEKADDLRLRFGADIRIFPFDPVDVSSTQIREAVQAGEPLTGLVPDAVELYIRIHGLYRDTETDDEE
ncbi:MAG: nicotinate-nucleotide adenylyltransferase [Lachnospiraceae bacterium]|nr:nicotinate-nucleotide adenylyltransferase [Lachnospiraceae bacterium]